VKIKNGGKNELLRRGNITPYPTCTLLWDLTHKKNFVALWRKSGRNSANLGKRFYVI